MNVYATECHGDRVLLTRKLPIIKLIDHTDILDAFPDPGEPVAVAHLCRAGFRAALGHELAAMALDHLVPTRIDLEIKVHRQDLLIARPVADALAINRLLNELSPSVKTS